MAAELSIYELEALQEINSWKHPKKTWLDKMDQWVNRPMTNAADRLTSAPGASWVVENVVGRLISNLNNVAHWSVRREAIYQEYRKLGYEVTGPGDIFRLDLEVVDKAIGHLKAKYTGLAAAEGAATGAVGLPGIPADIVALITLNQRAVAEYATYCGFDVSRQEERLFAMTVLGLATTSSVDEARDAALAHMVHIAKNVARKQSWKRIEKNTFLNVISRIAQAMGVRMVKAKIIQILPAIGAGVGASYNGYYTHRLCQSAFYLYRERFLADKYGPELITSKREPHDLLWATETDGFQEREGL